MNLDEIKNITITKAKAVEIIKSHGLLDELNNFWFECGIKEIYRADELYLWLGY